MLNAHYFDGRSARLQLAPLRIEDGEIALGGEVGKTYRAAGSSPPKEALKGIDLKVPAGSIFVA